MMLLVYLCIVDHEGGAGQDEPGPRREVVEDAGWGPGHGHEAGLSSSEAHPAAEVEQLGPRHDINSHEQYQIFTMQEILAAPATVKMWEANSSLQTIFMKNKFWVITNRTHPDMFSWL